MILDYIALGTIVFMAIGATAAIVVTGGLPGKIARKRNHPWPDAVNMAGWIGLATGVLWPLAMVWAFLPVPTASPPEGRQSETNVDRASTATSVHQPTRSGIEIDHAGPKNEVQPDQQKFQQQIDALAKIVSELQSNSKEVDG